MTAFHKSTMTYEAAEPGAKDILARKAMEDSNKRFLAGLNGGPVPQNLVWRRQDVTRTLTFTPEHSDVRRVTRIQALDRQADQQRVSRDPCPLCNVRSDLGCTCRRRA